MVRSIRATKAARGSGAWCTTPPACSVLTPSARADEPEEPDDERRTTRVRRAHNANRLASLYPCQRIREVSLFARTPE